MANVIKVHSVDQEYWYIRTQRCKCGGELEVWNQALLSSQDLQFDVLDTRCKHCGHETSYKFDITNFAPRAITQQSMEKIAMGIPAEKVWSFIEIPMEKAVKFIFDLAQAQDKLALDYLEGAIKHAREKFKIILD